MESSDGSAGSGGGAGRKGGPLVEGVEEDGVEEDGVEEDGVEEDVGDGGGIEALRTLEGIEGGVLTTFDKVEGGV